jgi:para-nitrobenzyl esterase
MQGGKKMLREKCVLSPRVQERSRPRRSLLKTLCSSLALGIAVAWAAPVLASSTKVTAPDGTFEGKFDTTGAMREFLGIRYAQAVTGNLRWKPPQPVTPASVTQDATQFGNHCPQVASPFGNASSTEDCLFLNVFTPNGNGDRGTDGDDAALPVMVWIHGGALVVGESNEYNASQLVARRDRGHDQLPAGRVRIPCRCGADGRVA